MFCDADSYFLENNIYGTGIRQDGVKIICLQRQLRIVPIHATAQIGASDGFQNKPCTLHIKMDLIAIS